MLGFHTPNAVPEGMLASDRDRKSSGLQDLLPLELLPEVASIDTSGSTAGVVIQTSSSVPCAPAPSNSDDQQGNGWRIYATFVDICHGPGGRAVSIHDDVPTNAFGEKDTFDYHSKPLLTVRDALVQPVEESTGVVVQYTCQVPQQMRRVGCGGAWTVLLLRALVSLANDREELERKVMSTLQEIFDEAQCVSPQLSMGDVDNQGSVRPLLFASESSIEGIQLLSQLSLEFVQSAATVESVCYEEAQPPDLMLSKDDSIGQTADDEEEEDEEDEEGISSWTSWFTSPKFTKEDEEKEIKSMCFDDLAAAVEDVYGTAHVLETKGIPLAKKQLREKPQASRDELATFDVLLDRVPHHKKKALLLAQQYCPEQVTVGQKSPFIVCNESNDPMFAVNQFCKHWEKRLKIFGPEKAFLPLTLDGALKDDWKALTELDCGAYMPGAEDKFGRTIVYAQGPTYCSTKEERMSILRALWYHGTVATTEMGDIRKGVVQLLDLSSRKLNEVDKILTKDMVQLEQFFPMVTRAVHIVRPPWYHTMLEPVMKSFLPKSIRCRQVVHKAASSEKEILSKLEQYGIHQDVVPTQLGGKYVHDVRQWSEQRREKGL